MQQFLNSIALKGSRIIRHFPSNIAVNNDLWWVQTHVSAGRGRPMSLPFIGARAPTIKSTTNKFSLIKIY